MVSVEASGNGSQLHCLRLKGLPREEGQEQRWMAMLEPTEVTQVKATVDYNGPCSITPPHNTSPLQTHFNTLAHHLSLILFSTIYNITESLSPPSQNPPYYCLKLPETCAFISANVAVKSTLFSLYTELRLGMKGVCGLVWEAPLELELFFTGDSKCPRKLEREKSLTSLLSHWVSDCCRRREGDEGGEGGVLESVGKPDVSPTRQLPLPPAIPPTSPPPTSPRPCALPTTTQAWGSPVVASNSGWVAAAKRPVEEKEFI
ncbi:hypothetical protein E2C01_026723 [Portunus trituberculatus]|uniref:Uncharacterized protein n=1 Tax=Portunus trituberculatus TaxID=210409 RepID=A0A5B7EIY0_PORTR|nr:hypothetical protein [Portunus trituberculatus]